MKTTLFILTLIIAACAQVKAPETNDQPAVEETPTAVPTPTPTIIVDEGPTEEHRIIDGARPALQLLSKDQIKKHLSCIDSRFELTSIHADSIMVLGQTPGEGTDAFLLPNLYSAGENIVDRNADLLDGPESLTKTGTKLNSPSLDYLVALSNIANVVAHNCEIIQKSNTSINSDVCDCKSDLGATKMIDECLAILNLADSEKQTLKDSFQEQCNVDPKEAISSLIASWGYVVSP